MREPVLTPEQANAARWAAQLEWEKTHAAAEERKALILQVIAPSSAVVADASGCSVPGAMLA